MSVREVAVPDLVGSAKDLFVDRCVVAITPVAGDSEWADEAAWSIARAAASTGRKTALIDLNLENPRLHTQSKDPKETGIVDAFLFGASLQHVASKEEELNLHFIGVGTPPGEPDEVWGNERWERLFRGFKKEGALLLLFLPPVALEVLALPPDLILAVTSRGLGSGDPKTPQLRAAIDRGVPLVMVTDGPDAAPVNQGAEADDNSAHLEQGEETTGRRSGVPRKILLAISGVVVVAAVAVTVLLLSERSAVQAPNVPATGAPLAAVASNSTLPPTADPLVGVGDTDQAHSDSILATEEAGQRSDKTAPIPDADSLPFSIQVAAWAQLRQAQDHLALFESAGIISTITAVPRDSGRHWYRVVVGAVIDYGAADELRQRLRAEGLIGSTRGVLLNTPFALLLETHPDTLSGRAAQRGLRESGIPAYIVSMPDGSVQVLVGAFESPDQAELINSVFPEADRNLSRTLIVRMGIAR